MEKDLIKFVSVMIQLGVKTIAIFGIIAMLLTYSDTPPLTKEMIPALIKASLFSYLFYHLIKSIILAYGDFKLYGNCDCHQCRHIYQGPVITFLKHFLMVE